MAIKFSNCEVSIDGARILAQNASISQGNSVSPARIVGYKNVVNNSVPIGPIKNDIKISYILETNNEPNYYLSRALLGYAISSPVVINVANIIATGYLDSYSISVSENSPVIANANYIIFHELNISPSEQSSTGYLGFNSLNSLGIAHYWSCRIYDNGLVSNGKLINLNYNFKADWSPQYKIGDRIPSQVIFKGGQESFDITSELDININYSGEQIQNNSNLTNCSVLQLNNLSYEWGASSWFPIYLYPSGGIIISHDTNLTEDSIIISQTKLVKSF